MCGLIAAFSVRPVSVDCVRRGMAQLARRGPDGEGLWLSDAAVLGHRRLAVLDLSQLASQPMRSACGRYIIVFNGEIYNFRDLKRELELAGTAFRTVSDTEVLLELFAREGVAALSKLRGMFAFVIWDVVCKFAIAARDPYGIKPLYLGRMRDGWLVGSQIKALLATGLISGEANALGQGGFWLLGSVPEPHTWYRDVTMLPAGTWTRLSATDGLSRPKRYCDIGNVWRSVPPCPAHPSEVQKLVQEATLESVRQHLVADVPIGIFLSGGVDSGSLAGLMVDAGATSVQGITIVFSDFEGSINDETSAAQEIARHYNVDHHVRRVGRDEFEADLPRIIAAMDQPSIDGINTWYASKAVAELGLKVVMSGIGGDELFYGYRSFQQLPNLVAWWRQVSKLPGANFVASLMANEVARRSGNPRWRWVTRQAADMYGAYWLRRGLFAPEDLPSLLTRELADDIRLDSTPSALMRAMAGSLPDDLSLAVGQLESMVYLRNQLLRDSDWASMYHGVELRTPLVDATLLATLKSVLRCFDRSQGKLSLANSPSKPLPPNIYMQRKVGFGTPVLKWVSELDSTVRVREGARGLARWVAKEYHGVDR